MDLEAIKDDKGIKRSKLTPITSSKKPKKLINGDLTTKEVEEGKKVKLDDGESARLKDFNALVREFVDRNLDKMTPISKQPREKVQAIVDSCGKRFPEFKDGTRKRIRNYLKSCRRTQGMKASKPNVFGESSQSQMAMANENHNIEPQRDGFPSSPAEETADLPQALIAPTSLQQLIAFTTQRTPFVPNFVEDNEVTQETSLTSQESVISILLVDAYRTSAALLLRAAKELEDRFQKSEDIVNE